MRRTKEEAEKTKEMLLISAVNVFNEKGYANTTLTDIAKRANVTRGAIYHHFGCKEDFIDQLIARDKSRLEAYVNNVLKSGGDFLTELRNGFNKILSELEKKNSLAHVEELWLKLNLSGDLCEHKNKMKNHMDNAYKFLITAVDKAKKRGEISEDTNSKQLSNMIVSIYIGIFVAWLLHPNKISLKKDGLALLENLLNNIRIKEEV